MPEINTNKNSNISQPVWLIQSLRNLKIPNRIIYVFLLLVITAIAFSSSLNNSFTNWDDPLYVLNNFLIRSLSLQNICHMFAPTTFSAGYYHPVTILSLAVNYKIGQLDPFGYILFNLVLHLLSVCIVFSIIRKLFKNDLVAFICALIFGIHPMQVEAVAWVADRKDVIFAFFYLASVFVYLRYIEKEGKNAIFSYLGVFILFTASLLSKATAVTVPAILILIDYYKGRKFNIKLILEKIPFLILSAIIVFIEMKSQKEYGAIAPKASFAVLQKRFIICYGYDCIFYITRFFAPVKLSACYPTLISLPNKLPFVYYAGFLGVLAILAVDIYLIKRNKIIFFGLTFFLITISTGLQFRFLNAGMIADRYTYIPFIGLSFIVAYYFEKVILGVYLKGLRKALITAAVIVIIIFSYSTFERCKVWKNSGVLFTDVINKHPDISVAYVNRGSYNFNNASYDEAIRDYSKAIELDTSYALAYYNRGIAYYSVGKPDYAIIDFNKAIQLNPGYVNAYNNRGIAYMNWGKTYEAINDYNEAIKLNPNYTDAYYNRGIAFKTVGNLAEAIIDFSMVIKQNPDFIEAYINRGIAYKAIGNADLAINDFSKIIQLFPQEAEMYRQRGECYKMKGLSNEAESDFRKYNELLKK